MFVIGMLDAPAIDYDKKKNDKIHKPSTAEEEINFMTQALG